MFIYKGSFESDIESCSPDANGGSTITVSKLIFNEIGTFGVLGHSGVMSDEKEFNFRIELGFLSCSCHGLLI